MNLKKSVLVLLACVKRELLAWFNMDLSNNSFKWNRNSNFETFQANRLKLRFKNAEGKSELAHTLNGSSLALPRVLAGILENYQTDEGIQIPEVLIPYTGFSVID
jgi:seryl-tRNA synthetase